MAHTRLDRYERLYSHRTGTLRSSAMRDLMAVTSRPEVISLAGGLPDTRAFPPDLLEELMADVARQHGPRALQYGPTEGLYELRQALAEQMEAADGTLVGVNELIVTTGGQQALDLVCRVLIDPGDAILAEGPTYPGAVPVFSSCGADVHQVPMDADGLRLDALAEAHDRLEAEGRRPKLLYTIPSFHNPAGVTMPLERRRALVAFAQERDLLVIEDDPYSQLRFEGGPLPTLRSLDATGRVVYVGTMSKVFSPGVRVGFVHAPHPILHRVNLSKQAADLCTSPLAQLLALAFLRHPRRPEVLAQLGRLYRSRRDAMVEALHEALPDSVFTVPTGGLFMWVTHPDGLDTTDLLAAALERNVAFVPGAAAYLNGEGRSSMRLNFSAMEEERIAEGIRRIGDVVRERTALARALQPRSRRGTDEA